MDLGETEVGMVEAMCYEPGAEVNVEALTRTEEHAGNFLQSTISIIGVVATEFVDETERQKLKSIFSFLFLLQLMVVLSETSFIILDGKGTQGGASRRAGGRDERPPQILTPGAGAPSLASQRWVPPSNAGSKRDGYSCEVRQDAIFRKVRGILNKLTPEKFDKLGLELLNVGIDSELILKGIILLIFEKALDEPKYSSLYAHLCHRLCEDSPNFEPPSSSISSFRRLLLNKCQDEFENRSCATEVFDKVGILTIEEEEQYAQARRKMLGNIKFICELGKLDMLHESILHQCIKQLLAKKKKAGLKEVAEDLECLCQIMKTIGKGLDNGKAKLWMDQYFLRMETFMVNMELPSRIRFMLRDVAEQRGNSWVPRDVLSDSGPKTIQQVREEAAKELGLNTRSSGHVPVSPMSINDFFSHCGPRQGGGGGMADMFSSMPPQFMAGMSIGTGPGVIHTDSISSMPYGGLGRQRNQQNQNGKELPPRFRRQQQMQTSNSGNTDEISLRPARNFMLRPNIPSMLPKSAQSPKLQQGAAPIPLISNIEQPKPIMQKKSNIKIKQVTSVDKPKPNKKTPSQDEIKQAMEDLLNKLLTSENVEEAVSDVKEMRAPTKYMPDLVSYSMLQTLPKTEMDRSTVSKLIASLRDESIITAEHYVEGFTRVLDKMEALTNDIPLVKSHVARFSADAVINNIVSLNELAAPMEGGTHYPLFLLCLQQLKKLKDEEWLTKLFNESKLDLQKMLPEPDQNKERMMAILEDRSLSFLFPLLHLQTELWLRIQTEPSATDLYKWVRDKVDLKLQKAPGFIVILVTSVVKYVLSKTSLVEGQDTSLLPDKSVIEEEKQLLGKFMGVLQKFLVDASQLQLAAIYALQVLCYNNHFPKGLLLRLFMFMYDSEVIDEEVFLRWKEEVNEQYPGKGKALFQVNQWLMWLEQAEEESDEED
ncbi:Eukaryotic translation initiation factor 4 gamma 2 [Lamellibrachia satsuma]|nr:Eukaryotic translation initiation factor 4 gamma 2 [Lamellibrachia satsuma]